MKFEARYFPELGVSTDVTRTHLLHVFLDLSEKKLVSTNGHILLVIPCEVEAKDVDGLVSVEAIEYARRAAGGGKTISVGCSADKLVCRGATFDRPSEGESGKGVHAFPPWRSVLPTYKRGDKGTVTFGVDANYIRQVTRGIGVGDECFANVVLTLPTGSERMIDPFVVRDSSGNGSEAFAILMPIAMEPLR